MSQWLASFSFLWLISHRRLPDLYNCSLKCITEVCWILFPGNLWKCFVNSVILLQVWMQICWEQGPSIAYSLRWHTVKYQGKRKCSNARADRMDEILASDDQTNTSTNSLVQLRQRVTFAIGILTNISSFCQIKFGAFFFWKFWLKLE